MVIPHIHNLHSGMAPWRDYTGSHYRVDAGATPPSLGCNNAGIPLTLVHWPGGAGQDLTQAASFQDLRISELPAFATPPVFVDDMDVRSSAQLQAVAQSTR